MTKLVTRITGGIGNQLFCYAAARRLAIENNAELIIDDVSGFDYDYKYQRQYQLDHFSIPCRKATAAERLEPFSRIRRYFKRTVNRLRPFEHRMYIQQEGIDFDSRLLEAKPRGTVYLEGYWQSENYFKDVEAKIREDLSIKPPVDTMNLEVAAHIYDSLAVAVHVRFFDAPTDKGSNNVPNDYYVKAIKKLEILTHDPHYFVFSDCPNDARTLIPLPNDRVTFVKHNQGDANAYADLWLMTMCKHFIIANSSFSWWGAWLAEHPGKHVIAPSFQNIEGVRVTSWNFKGLLPSRWMQL